MKRVNSYRARAGPRRVLPINSRKMSDRRWRSMGNLRATIFQEHPSSLQEPTNLVGSDFFMPISNSSFMAYCLTAILKASIDGKVSPSSNLGLSLSYIICCSSGMSLSTGIAAPLVSSLGIVALAATTTLAASPAVVASSSLGPRRTYIFSSLIGTSISY